MVYIVEIKNTLEETIEEFVNNLKNGEIVINTSFVGDKKLLITTKESKNGNKKLLLG